MLTLVRLKYDEFVLISEDTLYHGTRAAIIQLLLSGGYTHQEVRDIFAAVANDEVLDECRTILHTLLKIDTNDGLPIGVAS